MTTALVTVSECTVPLQVPPSPPSDGAAACRTMWILFFFFFVFSMVYKKKQDQSQLAPLWHETPSWLSDGFMFFHPLYGLQYYSNSNVYCAVTLSQNYELMQRLGGLHESPVCFADFSTKFCWNKSTFYSSQWESLFPALFSFFSNNYWEKKK